MNLLFYSQKQITVAIENDNKSQLTNFKSGNYNKTLLTLDTYYSNRALTDHIQHLSIHYAARAACQDFCLFVQLY